MIKEHIIITKQKGETQAHIDICKFCPLPASKCNGECDYYKAQAKLIRQNKPTKKKVVVY